MYLHKLWKRDQFIKMARVANHNALKFKKLGDLVMQDKYLCDRNYCMFKAIGC